MYNDHNDILDADSQTKSQETNVDNEYSLYFPEFTHNRTSISGSAYDLVLEALDVVISAMIAVIVIFSFIFRVPTIEGNSMNDTLFNGERVVISNLMYEPKYGDIVVISRNYTNDSENIERYSMPIIKRVIATAGQTVDIDFNEGIVYVDGKALEENYTRTATNLSYDVKFPVKVKDNCVFVLGDNRNDSLDSRSSQIGDGGMIDKRFILGKAFLRIFPFDRFGKIG